MIWSPKEALKNIICKSSQGSVGSLRSLWSVAALFWHRLPHLRDLGASLPKTLLRCYFALCCEWKLGLNYPGVNGSEPFPLCRSPVGCGCCCGFGPCSLFPYVLFALCMLCCRAVPREMGALPFPWAHLWGKTAALESCLWEERHEWGLVLLPWNNAVSSSNGFYLQFQLGLPLKTTSVLACPSSSKQGASSESFPPWRSGASGGLLPSFSSAGVEFVRLMARTECFL